MASIGVFDSGYGGLTVFRQLVQQLPQYDYVYLGDNGRAPYGTRSFETVYKYTLQCVEWLLRQDCPLIILACNTASAKALRTIQQHDLQRLNSEARVLGVIRPTTEVIGKYTETGHIGILATNGTVQSNSYAIEIGKFYPEVSITQEACPMWVPLVENNEHNGPGADYFIEKHVRSILLKNPRIDTLLLACTHYPLLKDKIREHLPASIQLLSQGEIVAESLKNYLERHPEIESRLSRGGQRRFYTTDSTEEFNRQATTFFGGPVVSQRIDIELREKEGKEVKS
ncbi:glutamate racemase [Paraflavisolibacter sp. H34]|uniref:glutamate racemase n=1 Tax=Huijunlia imazamoxiresistens TaxID=3127457 RepID=UPI0030195528